MGVEMHVLHEPLQQPEEYSNILPIATFNPNQFSILKCFDFILGFQHEVKK